MDHRFMNIKQGNNPFNDSMASVESTSLSPAYSPQLEFLAIIEQKSHIDGNVLAKVLFICNKCDGPLVPSENCPVCERACVRKCVKCENEVFTGNHLACEYLVLLSKLRSKRNPKGHGEVKQ
jgi:hypothetical protein